MLFDSQSEFGAVNIQGSDGLTVNGNVGIGTMTLAKRVGWITGASGSVLIGD